jgi:hypothetical protein
VGLDWIDGVAERGGTQEPVSSVVDELGLLKLCDIFSPLCLF